MARDLVMAMLPELGILNLLADNPPVRNRVMLLTNERSGLL